MKKRSPPTNLPLDMAAREGADAPKAGGEGAHAVAMSVGLTGPIPDQDGRFPADSVDRSFVDLRGLKVAIRESRPMGDPAREAVLAQPDRLEASSYRAVVRVLLALLRLPRGGREPDAC